MDMLKIADNKATIEYTTKASSTLSFIMAGLCALMAANME